jgi:ankyrin repeat protein
VLRRYYPSVQMQQQKRLQVIQKLNFNILNMLQNFPGSQPLHLAAAVGSLNCIERLVEHGVDVCARDDLGRTPLHMAAIHGNARCVYLLIKHGPDALKVVDAEGNTPHQVALNSNNKEAAEIIEVSFSLKSLIIRSSLANVTFRDLFSEKAFFLQL